MATTSEQRRERRRLLLARVDVEWSEAAETRTERGMLEDVSPGGCCLRLRTPLAAGTRVKVLGYRDQISGTIRHCRRSGTDHLMGVRRDVVS